MLPNASISMVRAYLKTFALATVIIQVSLVIPMIFIFHFSGSNFETASFRICAALALASMVIIARLAAWIAFWSSIKRGYIQPCCRARYVCMRENFSFRWLALLHLRYTRRSAVPWIEEPTPARLPLLPERRGRAAHAECDRPRLEEP
jgi:hypothetical protein